MTDPTALRDWVVRGIRDLSAQWSVGTFGAIAEFSRDPAEPASVICADAVIAASTGRGGLRIEISDNVRAVAYETTAKDPTRWGHAIALCLPVAACPMNRRIGVRELGVDGGAIRPQDRESILFDLGLGTVQVDVCIRTLDADLLHALRAAEGRALLEAGNPAMPAILRASPQRVFITRIGRAEVYQAIPPTDGRSPDGPHTHVLPKLLRSGRTHSATIPIPDGWAPCIHLYPAHPQKDGFGAARTFDRERHETFQQALAQFGDPALTDLKRRVMDGLAIGNDPKELVAPSSRFSRATIRVALRQALALYGPSETLTTWRHEHDREHANVRRDGHDDSREQARCA